MSFSRKEVHSRYDLNIKIFFILYNRYRHRILGSFVPPVQCKRPNIFRIRKLGPDLRTSKRNRA